ncbi:MAG: biliverdin-producing heme oxygenase [Rickettsiales bacterium]
MTLDSALHKTLKDATHDAHEALHLHPLLKSLSKLDITLHHYQAIIQAFSAAYKIMEAKRDFALTQGIPDAPVLSWLEADRKRHDIHEIVFDGISYPSATSYNQLLGYLYVKQGSMLGGRVITKNLSSVLAMKEKEDNHFFAGYGNETGKYWKIFLSQLECEESETDSVVAQANAAFHVIKTCCDKSHAMLDSNE